MTAVELPVGEPAFGLAPPSQNPATSRVSLAFHLPREGDVNAAVGGSGLTINNAGQAKCKDGSTYKLPNVTCKPGATSAADCSGQYDNSNKFPISMKQGG